MRHHTFGAALLLITLASTPALAQSSGPWVSVGAGIVDAETDERSGAGFTATTLGARIGYDFGRYFGVEAEGALGLSGSGEDRSGAPDRPFGFDERFEYAADYGVFLRGRVPVSDRVEIFARIGLGGRDLDVEILQTDGDGNPLPVTEITRNDTYGALGIGAQFAFGTGRQNAVRVDASLRGFADFSEEDSNNPTDTALSVAYVRRF